MILELEAPTATSDAASIDDLRTGGISLLESLGIAAGTLMANKLRTGLTALGVIIGVASVVALLALGNGAQQQIAERITANGANLLTVRTEGAAGGGKAKLTLDDANGLADSANVPHASRVSAETTGIASIVAGNQNKTTIVAGVTSAYAATHNSKLASGSFIDDGQANSRVTVLGPRLAKSLFSDSDPVGQQVRIKGQSFKVVGVLAAKGSGSFGFDDDAAFIPLNLAVGSLFGGRVAGSGNKAAVQSIVVQARDKDSIDAAKREIQATLRDRHRLPSYGGADDFTINNQQDLIDTLTQTSRTMTIFLSAIAAISLIVGGIGIMNIMLVSVRERTREIGLRKAVGARERDILAQFLIEALTLSALGGLIGLIAGVVIAVVANDTSQSRAVVTPESVLLAVGFSLAVGLFFGIEPARRAARLDPIEALRYE
ncbi:MAG: ABC transporter permease [Chloroflexia bacterium]